MSMTINTNVVSLNAQRNMNTSQSSLATSMQRLSSGLRVNSAKDDAAGLAIAERMSAQVRGSRKPSGGSSVKRPVWPSTIDTRARQPRSSCNSMAPAAIDSNVALRSGVIAVTAQPRPSRTGGRTRAARRR